MIGGAQPARAASARSRCSPTGPIASPPAKCRRRRRGRRASSATSSSRSGTGPIRRRISTTWSRPTGAIRRVNANGPIYGALELSADYLPVLDPVTHTIEPGAADGARSEHAADRRRRCRSRRRTGATKSIWTSKNNVHNPMLDEKGRVWITSAVRPPDNPDFCKEGSSHPSAKLFPIDDAPAATSRSTIRRPRSSRTSAPASARTT